MIQSPRRLRFLVIFGRLVKCWSWVHWVSASADSVPSLPAPLSLVIGCLQAREFFCLFLLQAHLPRRALVLFFVCAVGPLVWTVHSDTIWAEIITVFDALQAYCFGKILNCNACNFTRRRFFGINLKTVIKIYSSPGNIPCNKKFPLFFSGCGREGGGRREEEGGGEVGTFRAIRWQLL